MMGGEQLKPEINQARYVIVLSSGKISKKLVY